MMNLQAVPLMARQRLPELQMKDGPAKMNWPGRDSRVGMWPALPGDFSAEKIKGDLKQGIHLNSFRVMPCSLYSCAGFCS